MKSRLPASTNARHAVLLLLLLLESRVLALPIDVATAGRLALDVLRADRSDVRLQEPVFLPGDAECGCYVFNAEGGGWVIVAADDELASPILAFNTSGRFLPAEVEEPVRELLPNFANARDLLATSEQTVAPAGVRQARKAASSARSSVAPMIGSTWGQATGGFNELCPSVGGVTAGVGCIALTMGTVMYQHQWPRQLPYTIPEKETAGFGDWSGKKFTFPARAEGMAINWDAMLPAYTTISPSKEVLALETTSEQREAVALLLACCGQAVDMAYGPTGSGANPFNIPAAMAYFGYQSACSMSKTLFKVADTDEGRAYWEDIVHWELTQGRSVIYGGSSSSTGSDVGHSFVIDGYDGATGLFHVNWGWYGDANGYYNLALLNPTRMSGEKRQYSKSQTVVMGLAPKVELMRMTSFSLDGTKLTVNCQCLIDNTNLELECGLGHIGESGVPANYQRTAMPVLSKGQETSYTIDVSKLFTYVAYKNLPTGTEVRLYPMCQANLRRNSKVSASTLTKGVQCIGATLLGEACCILKKTSSGFTVTAIKLVPGDVNGDGDVTIADVTLLVNIILGKNDDTTAADVNGDGEVTIADVTALVNIILEK